MTNVNSKNIVLKYEEMKHFSTENKKLDGRNLQWWGERWICRLDLVEGTSNGGGSVDMQPRFGGRNLQWWRERWICRLDLVEGTSNGGGSVGYAASIWWKEPPMPPRFGGKSPKSPRHQLQAWEVRKSLSKKSLLAAT